MSLDTTKLQFRQKHFKIIHKIIVKNFGVSIQSESTKINEFAIYEHDVVDFEFLMLDKFDGDFNFEKNPSISDILDQICQ